MILINSDADKSLFAVKLVCMNNNGCQFGHIISHFNQQLPRLLDIWSTSTWSHSCTLIIEKQWDSVILEI